MAVCIAGSVLWWKIQPKSLFFSFWEAQDSLWRKIDLQQLPSRLPTTATPSPHQPCQPLKKNVFSFTRTRKAASQWWTKMENRFQIYLCWELSIFLRNNELWGHRRLVLFPACRDLLILEEKVTNLTGHSNSSDVLFPILMSTEPQKCSFFSLHYSSGFRKNSVAKGEKNWVTPTPSTHFPKNKTQLWPQSAYVFTVLGGAIPLTSRVPTRQHFPCFLDSSRT